jgi:hypothetical protein
VFCAGYLGGNGMRPWNPTSNRHLQMFKDGRMQEYAIFTTLGPMNRAIPNTSWLSMSGTMPSRLNASRLVQDEMRYQGHTAVSRMWGFNPENAVVASGEERYSAENNDMARKYNVICMQELQIQYEPTGTGGDGCWKKVTIDQGHWGEKVYPGCGKVYTCDETFLNTPSYIQTKTTALE